jgi:hypothetical protein
MQELQNTALAPKADRLSISRVFVNQPDSSAFINFLVEGYYHDSRITTFARQSTI